MKTRCPRPLDEGDFWMIQIEPAKEAGDSKKLGDDSQELTFKIPLNYRNSAWPDKVLRVAKISTDVAAY